MRMARLTIIERLAHLGLQLLAGTGAGYFGLLTGATFLKRERTYRPELDSMPVQFAVVVPAHNEEHQISRTLKSLEQLAYPPGSYRVFVIADNCSDATADVARRFSCTVLERKDPQHKSKGHALNWAFERVPEGCEAIVVIDADSVADSELLVKLSGFYRASPAAEGEALQGTYFIHMDGSTVSAANYLAFALHNVLKPHGIERIGGSVGLKGNGMCLPRSLLKEVPWRRYGLAEDLEYHVDLVLAGRRVRFVPEAQVKGVASNTTKGNESQRLRWERGKIDALRRFTVPLLRSAIKKRDVGSLEVLLSMLVPPFSLAVGSAALCIALGVKRRSKWSMTASLLELVALAGAALRALWLVRAPVRIYLHLPALPLFIVWRAYIALRSLLWGAGLEWKRTERRVELDD